MTYPAKKLEDYIEILSGFAFKSKDFSTDGIPVIKIKNIVPPSVTLEDLSYIPNDIAEQQSKFLLRYNDVLIALTGSHINQMASVVGRVAKVKYSIPTLLNQRVGKITVKKESECDIRYIFYYLSQDTVKIQLAKKAGGAANQANISPSDIKNLWVPLPDILTQRRIADILSAYDDLIENNQKQIKLLEEAAQRLYKEWFVDLRFPGHETTPIIDGVPEGWNRFLLSEIIEYEIGGGWGEEEPLNKCEHPAFVIRGTDLSGILHGEIMNIPFRYHAKNNLDSRMLVDGDIIFEVSGGSKTEGVARTALISQALLTTWGKPVMCASFCKLIRTKQREHAQLLYHTFQHMRESGKTTEYDKRSASSIVNYRWKDFLSTETVLIPATDLLIKYNMLAETMYSLIVDKSITIEKARACRDRLLPKLMSGEIEV